MSALRIKFASINYVDEGEAAARNIHFLIMENKEYFVGNFL